MAAVAAGAAIAVVAIAGTALAAGPGGGGSFLDDFTRHLGVAPAKVRVALQQTYRDRLEQLVKQGRLTKQQAQLLEQRITEHAGNRPLPLWMPMRGRRRFGGRFDRRRLGRGPLGSQFQAAAGYLGITGATLFGDLRDGKTLAAVAAARGKSVAGLEAAMLAAAERDLNAAVARGRLTKAQAARFQGFLRDRIDAFVQHGFRFRGRTWGASALPAAQS